MEKNKRRKLRNIMQWNESWKDNNTKKTESILFLYTINIKNKMVGGIDLYTKKLSKRQNNIVKIKSFKSCQHSVGYMKQYIFLH